MNSCAISASLSAAMRVSAGSQRARPERTILIIAPRPPRSGFSTT